MSLTTDPTDGCLRIMRADGMQECYLVLSEEERKKGFVRPVRTSYKHLQCGVVTEMGLAIAETYARDPSFYGGTYCAFEKTHFPLFVSFENADGSIDPRPQFEWTDDCTPVGS